MIELLDFESFLNEPYIIISPTSIKSSVIKKSMIATRIGEREQIRNHIEMAEDGDSIVLALYELKQYKRSGFNESVIILLYLICLNMKLSNQSHNLIMKALNK